MTSAEYILHREYLSHVIAPPGQRDYADATGPIRMLRPMTEAEQSKYRDRLHYSDGLLKLWEEVYRGKLVVDDLFEIVAVCAEQPSLWSMVPRDRYLGNHHDWHVVIDDLNPEAEKPFAEALQSMNGGGIWRSPQDHG
jgi:hypothetical protein